MESITGARFARLLLAAFDAMVAEVQEELARRGHPHLTVGNEFAMQAIDAGASSAADLSRALGVTRQAAAKTITTLEGLDYVERTSNDADARQKRLLVTSHGREAIAIGAAAFDESYRRWVDVVGEDTAATTAAALRLVSARSR